jgi:ABC-2 type transport system ATP-binding protein/ribosome-dependent ATPase
MTSLAQSEDVVRRFGAQVAVDHVSMSVGAGEVVGLLGANGAGKSTLIRMLLGLLAPSAGKVELFGAPPSRSSRRRLGYVPQGLGLYSDLTVAENVAFVVAAFGADAPTLDADLAEVANRPVGTVSLGLRRRTAFAAALSHRPELLFLDEPTSGVGPLGRAELWSAIAAAADDGVGVLVSTHTMDEAEQCDRVLMMASGRIVAEGRAADITAAVTAHEVEVADWAAAFRAFAAANLSVSLVGMRVRVAGSDPATIARVLAAAGVEGTVRPVEAGFDEAFAVLAAR